MRTEYHKQTDQILAALGPGGILAEYRAMNVNFARGEPRANGWIECHAVGRDDRNASAAVNTRTGVYLDSSAAAGRQLSFFDFCATFGGGKFADWKAARSHYAMKTGIKLTGAKPPEGNWRDRLQFEDWSEGNEMLAKMWCRRHKPGTSYAALRAAGGRVAQLCHKRKNKETGAFEYKPGQYKVIALPAWGEGGIAADPQAWVAWNISGTEFRYGGGKSHSPETVRKMESIGPTTGTMMGLYGLQRVGNPETEVIIKTAGPTDMLAVMSLVPPELRDKYLVVTNGSTETGDVFPHQVMMFAGKRAWLLHDGDRAGETGVLKWRVALQSVAEEVRAIRFFREVKEKHGDDMRDWVMGKVEELSPADWPEEMQQVVI